MVELSKPLERGVALLLGFQSDLLEILPLLPLRVIPALVKAIPIWIGGVPRVGLLWLLRRVPVLPVGVGYIPSLALIADAEMVSQN